MSLSILFDWEVGDNKDSFVKGETMATKSVLSFVDVLELDGESIDMRLIS
jgi:hypothetical protein